VISEEEKKRKKRRRRLVGLGGVCMFSVVWFLMMML